jgi:uracil-DNA glycosylase
MTLATRLHQSWEKLLLPELKKPYFNELSERVAHAYAHSVVHPPQSMIFNAFTYCPYNTLKVVILGQDPYINTGEAHGLAFSVPDNIHIPPSLKNIFTEIHEDIGAKIPDHGNLERWAAQGVLLLNTTLTVEAGQSNSHHTFGWERFTDAVIQLISQEKEQVVFLLWGNNARNKQHLISTKKHLVLQAPHPSPLSAYRGFFGCKHFSATNTYLKKHGQVPIEW